MTRVFSAVYGRDVRLACRRRVQSLLPLAFFVVAASLFPLGVGPEADTLRQIAPGVLWACALLAAITAAPALYAADHADGSLEQLLLSGDSPIALAAAKAAAQWTVSGAPLVVAAPLLGLMFGLEPDVSSALFVSLLLGTPTLSLLGGLGAALTLGLRGGGMLIVLLVLPLAVPALVFGAGAGVAVADGLSPAAHYSLLGAMLIAALVLAPPATAAALRIATE